MSENILNLGYELETGILKTNLLDNTEQNNIFKNFTKSKNFEFCTDGSINLSDYDKNTAIEFNSCVYRDIKTKEDLKPLFEDFKQLVPIIKEVNHSCGLHVHLSFKNMSDYYTLLNFDFVNQFLKAYEEKFKDKNEIDRLNNRYCAKYENLRDFNKITKIQLRYNAKCSARYKAINFNSFNLYKTIEFRIFPSVDNLNKFKAYVNFLYDFVINYLKKDKNYNKEIVILLNKKTKEKPTDYKKEFNTITEDEIIKIGEVF